MSSFYNFKKITTVPTSKDFVDIVLSKVGYIPGFCANLFSVTSALQKGGKLSNEGTAIFINVNDVDIKCDVELRSSNGFVMGKVSSQSRPVT